MQDASASEPSGGADNTASFLISIENDGARATPLRVNFTVSGNVAGGAVRGADYTLNTQEPSHNFVTIPAGQSSFTLIATPLADSPNEGTESFAVTLEDTDPNGAQNYLRNDTKASAIASIQNHAPLTVTVEAADPAAREGTASDRISFRVTRNGDTSAEMKVHYQFSGTATRFTDYDGPDSPVAIPVGKAFAFVNVTTREDSLMEGSETVVLTLRNDPQTDAPPAAGYTLGLPATAILEDDDLPSVSVTVSTASVAEGATTTGGGFRFERSTSAGDLTVQYTVSGTAAAGTDYTALAGEVEFTSGQSARTVPVATLQDDTAESPETVVVQVSAGSGYLVTAPTQATLTIVDDDQPTVQVAVLTEGAQEKGPAGTPVNAVFNVTRTAVATASSLTVRFAVGGTATSGADYTALGNEVVIPPGKTFAHVTVRPIDDAAAEPSETVQLSLTAGQYAIGSPSTAVVSIADNDGLAPGNDGDTIPAANDNCPTEVNQDQVDTDKDGKGDACDDDDDNDTLSDAEERRQGTSATAADSDGDGLSDPAELDADTDPLDRFSPDWRARSVLAVGTGNGVRVSWEVPVGGRADRFQVWRLSDPELLATLPFVPGQFLYSYEDATFPGGSHTYYVQAMLPGQQQAAFDADTATAAPPVHLDLCKARTADSDNDTVCDAREQLLGTNLFDPDSDSDGVSDGDEVAAGTDPTLAEGEEESDGGKWLDWSLSRTATWVLAGSLALLALLVIVAVVLLRRRKPGEGA